MQFTMTVQMDNAAFEGDPGIELGRILQSVAKKAKDGDSSGVVMDSNGNRVGEWDIEGIEEIRNKGDVFDTPDPREWHYTD